MDLCYTNGELLLNDGSSSPSTDEETGLILAAAYPKRRTGRRKFKETRHPVYRGIRQRNAGKWVSEVRPPNGKTRIWLGTFPTAEMAARAHDVASMALRGRHGACLNFADSAWRLPVPASAATKDIQAAAAEAAELFRPVEADTTISPPRTEEVTPPHPESVFYMDEEMEFDMPGFFADMYQGLLMLPPLVDSWSSYCYNSDDVEVGDVEVSLWSYSM